MLGRTQRGRKGSNPLDLPNRLETDKITTLQNYKFNLSKNTRLKVSSLHTMNLGKDNEVTFDLWVVCKYQKGKRGKHGIEYLAYVVHRVTISLDYIYQDYRKRFGIESSYRLKNICRIRTTTKNPIIRLLFVGISFVLLNIWIYILWTKISC